MLRWLIKRALPTIAANLGLDVETIRKANGTYLHIIITVFGAVLVNRKVRVSDLSEPIDINIGVLNE